MDFSNMDLHGKSFGEIVHDLEINSKLGHFKNCGLFQNTDSEHNMYFGTRDFWIEAGVNQFPIFKRYLGTSKKKIENIPDAIDFVKQILDKLAGELIKQIKTTNTDLMLRKLFVLYEDTHGFYFKDRKTREKLSNSNSDISNSTLESNRNITLTLLDGLSIIFENCVVFQHTQKSGYCEGIDKKSADDLFDCDLLIKVIKYDVRFYCIQY